MSMECQHHADCGCYCESSREISHALCADCLDAHDGDASASDAMAKHTEIPSEDGLYWYFETGAKQPRPVLIDSSRYGRRFKSFSGAEQSWIRPGEYFIGQVFPPDQLA